MVGVTQVNAGGNAVCTWMVLTMLTAAEVADHMSGYCSGWEM